MGRLATQLVAAVNQFGGRVAVEEENGNRITYNELDRRVNKLSELLISNGLMAGDRVGILMEKSIDTIVSILAILRCRAAYVPADPYAPVSRATQIFSASQPRLLLTESLRTLWPTGWERKETFLSLEILHPELKTAQHTPLEGDTAYILFTSGSTGRPKGVVVSRNAAFAFVDWARTTFGVRPQDSVASFAPFHFDLSIFDIFVTLTAGACLFLFSDKTVRNPRLLTQLLAENQLSIIYATPSLLRLLYDHGKPKNHDLTNLRQVLYAGEAYPVAELAKLMRLLPNARVANLYGPTETNVVTYQELTEVPDSDTSSAVPIGRACPYARLLIWKNDGPVNLQVGDEGELLVAGTSLTSGYLDETANTTAFIMHDGERFYRTGDLVLVDKTGALVFLGRNDRMVKRRGYRVEPAESEAVLSSHPALGRVAAVAVKTNNSDVRIVAYYELISGAEKPSGLELAAYCRERLPAYLVPDVFRTIAVIPITTNQKTDYLTLQNLADGK